MTLPIAINIVTCATLALYLSMWLSNITAFL
ncbi:hypothetical protein VPHK449_0067 [Vibrio phage K449]